MKKITTLLAGSLLATGAFAQEDPVLNIYNWSDYIAEDTIAKFTEETGIEVNYDVYDSNEVLEAKLLTGNSGYDIVVPTSNFMARQIKAGVYMPLDKSQLPNLENMNAGLMGQAAAYDSDNAHSVIYMWGTTGIGFNVDMVRARLGEDADLTTNAILWDPENAAKLADCGIALLDSPDETFPAVQNYLGLDPTSREEETMQQAVDHLKTLSPHIRYYHSSQYIDDLAAGEICIAQGFSGDVFIAADDAAEGVNINYIVPTEGAAQWFDLMGIPADAAHPENAHKFINFIMQGDITADITNYVFYASANDAATDMIDPEIAEDPAIFPSDEVLAKLWQTQEPSAQQSRFMNRAWTEIKTGQ